jgi:hypothetical protein
MSVNDTAGKRDGENDGISCKNVQPEYRAPVREYLFLYWDH